MSDDGRIATDGIAERECGEPQREPPCEFCHIAAGDEPAARLYADEQTVAFLDRQPAVTGHTLIVPRAHEGELFHLDAAATAAVFETVQTMTDALEAALEPDGFSVFYTSGPLVGTVEHAHVHLVPRFEDDSVSLALSRRRLGESDASELVSAIREYC
ncbi:HIT family protein [Natrialba asiatica]|uniref:Histidine triad (HIT) protein n=1 Tax=Natrialba asiatica (strain ATCC 700177 / DSM 12278 / JCM 9576 / FERM P-10747 / NBRC 102637 / 172P1) TaxID=29540 RepID=M0ALE8_NATA1|nr:HIT family protein [Natrialba asiatica]ELY99515.1 histidine triad (HIT) protein [Natrialba asiatica DSM 12278]